MTAASAMVINLVSETTRHTTRKANGAMLWAIADQNRRTQFTFIVFLMIFHMFILFKISAAYWSQSFVFDKYMDTYHLLQLE